MSKSQGPVAKLRAKQANYNRRLAHGGYKRFSNNPEDTLPGYDKRDGAAGGRNETKVTLVVDYQPHQVRRVNNRPEREVTQPRGKRISLGTPLAMVNYVKPSGNLWPIVGKWK
jgi:hypothetical protein